MNRVEADSTDRDDPAQLHDTAPTEPGNADGANPVAGVALDAYDNLYGTTITVGRCITAN